MNDNVFLIMILLLITTISFSCLIWIYFLLYFVILIKKSPTLEIINKHKIKKYPKVSIIVPALNEEDNISNCLESLLNQDYPNLEIVAINDSSTDKTDRIIADYKLKYPKKIVYIASRVKPIDWIGKNWACYLGYLKTTGQILLFTDADTILMTPSTISTAVTYLIEKKLEILTIRPSILLDSIWSKIVFPLLWIFSQIKYSSRHTNNFNNTGYLFGCFYLITRKAYESIGTHKAVKDELIEDRALGEKIKQKKLPLKMVMGEEYVETKITGNIMNIWQGLKRSINLFPFQQREVVICLLLFIFLLEPIISIFLMIYLQFLSAFGFNLILIQIFSIITLIDIILIFSLHVLQLIPFRSTNPGYALTFPVSCTIVSIGFIFFIAKLRHELIINWRGQYYTINNYLTKRTHR